jgi:NAD(P)-dependent dehydrogenase (short-subunit alcohol dehydrogenase family)
LLAQYPRTFRVERMDVASIAEVEALAAKLQGMPIDVLINNAGVFSDRSECRDENCRGEDKQTFGNIDYELFDTIMTVNVRGPLIVSESFIDNVRLSRQKKIIAIGSTNGSVSAPLPGPQGIAYRASKAALNRAMQLVAVKEKDEGVVVLIVHPGTVVTERLIGNRGLPGTVDTEPSVTGMIKVIDEATMADTGKFYQYDGRVARWCGRPSRPPARRVRRGRARLAATDRPRRKAARRRGHRRRARAPRPCAAAACHSRRE